MAKIDELLKELCPDGVELVKFTDYANVQYGFAFDAKKFTEDPVYLPLIRIRDIVSGTASTYYSGKYSPEYIVEPGDILVGMDGNFNLGVWKDSAGLLNQRVCKLFSKDEYILLNGFIKYYMKPIFNKIEQQTSAGSVKHLSAKTINSIKIHLPPLPIQHYIVEVLDTFTDAISNLEEELALREKQFEYYLHKILSIDELSQLDSCTYRIELLGNIGKICMCKRIMKDQTNTTSGVPFYKIGTFGKEADAYISYDLYNEYKSKFSFPKKGEVLISASGTIGRTVIYNGEDAYFQDSNIVWIENSEDIVLNKYLYI